MKNNTVMVTMKLNHPSFGQHIADAMGLDFRTASVEIKRMASINGDNYLSISPAKTNAEKREKWIWEFFPQIPRNVRFVRDNNTMIAYLQFCCEQKSAFAICDPKDHFDERLGKLIAWFRLNNWTPPDFVLED